VLPSEIVTRLCRRRHALHLNQAELAARIGVSDSALSRWERHKASPSLADFCAWTEELAVEITLTDREPPHVSP